MTKLQELELIETRAEQAYIDAMFVEANAKIAYQAAVSATIQEELQQRDFK